MTVSVSSKGIRTDTDCSDCEVLMKMNDGQAKTIDKLCRDVRSLMKQLEETKLELTRRGQGVLV